MELLFDTMICADGPFKFIYTFGNAHVWLILPASPHSPLSPLQRKVLKHIMFTKPARWKKPWNRKELLQSCVQAKSSALKRQSCSTENSFWDTFKVWFKIYNKKLCPKSPLSYLYCTVKTVLYLPTVQCVWTQSKIMSSCPFLKY